MAACLRAPNGELLDVVPFLTDADLREVPQPRPLRVWQPPKESE